MKIITQFSKRLRHLNEALAQLTMSETAVAGISHLFNVGEYYFNQKLYEPALYAYAKYAKYCPKGEKIPFVKERLVKMSSLLKNIRTEYEGNQINRTYHKNSMLFAEGEPGQELFIIQRGSVKIAKIADNKESILAILKAGEIFGEMALLEDKPRMASAMAYEDCNVMAINKANFEQLIFAQPQLVEKITIILADWIWFIYKKLANALISDPVGRVYDALQIQLEKSRIPLDGTFTQPFHTFNFGWSELLGMAGLSAEQNNPLFMKIKNNPKIQILDNKIHILSVMEIVRQAKYYRNMGRRDKVKRGSGN
jgi:CRP-like cAMP-binding protein